MIHHDARGHGSSLSSTLAELVSEGIAGSQLAVISDAAKLYRVDRPKTGAGGL